MIWKNRTVCAICAASVDSKTTGTAHCSCKRSPWNDCTWSEFFRFHNHRRWKLVFLVRPRNEKESAAWCGENSPRTKKLWFQKSKIKTMLILFFGNRGVVHQEFVPDRHTVNASFYHDVLDRRSKRIARIRPDLWKSWNFSLLHDNALAYTAIIMQ